MWKIFLSKNENCKISLILQIFSFRVEHFFYTTKSRKKNLNQSIWEASKNFHLTYLPNALKTILFNFWNRFKIKLCAFGINFMENWNLKKSTRFYAWFRLKWFYTFLLQEKCWVMVKDPRRQLKKIAIIYNNLSTIEPNSCYRKLIDFHENRTNFHPKNYLFSTININFKIKKLKLSTIPCSIIYKMNDKQCFNPPMKI